MCQIPCLLTLSRSREVLSRCSTAPSSGLPINILAADSERTHKFRRPLLTLTFVFFVYRCFVRSAERTRLNHLNKKKSYFLSQLNCFESYLPDSRWKAFETRKREAILFHDNPPHKKRALVIIGVN